MKLIKVFVASITILCLISFSSTLVNAETGDTEMNAEIIEKQAEIDQYLFEEYAEEIAEKGIFITHTAPLEDKVEIGITPYNEENATFLQEIFGTDHVKIVEGEQAVTLNLADDTSTEQASATGVQDVQTEVIQAEGTRGKTIVYSAVGAVVVIAGILFSVRRKKHKVQEH